MTKMITAVKKDLLKETINILFIEEDPFWQQELRRGLRDLGNNNFILFTANSAFDARRLFLQEKIDVVILDDFLYDGRIIDIAELIHEIRRGFDGLMIACCSDPKNAQVLVNVGCCEAVKKDDLLNRLLKLNMK